MLIVDTTLIFVLVIALGTMTGALTVTLALLVDAWHGVTECRHDHEHRDNGVAPTNQDGDQ